VQKPIDQHLVTDYLLGTSSDAITERLDELSLSDSEFVDQLRVAEDELVDAYIRGELSGETLTRFTSHYLVSPRRQEKVKIAKSIIKLVDRHAVPTRVGVGRQAEAASSRRFFVLPRFALQWGFATLAVLLMVGAAYLVFENFRLRNQMTKARSERATLEQREQDLQRQLESERTSSASIQQELAQVQERLAQLSEQESGGKAKKPVVIALNLSPQTRGASQIATVVVPTDSDSLALTLDLEATGFPAYEAVLKNPGSGQAIWRSGKVKAVRSGTALRLTLPANILKSQNYIIELSSFSPTGQAESAGSYSFRVHRS
jgi:hypothetical protein